MWARLISVLKSPKGLRFCFRKARLRRYCLKGPQKQSSPMHRNSVWKYLLMAAALIIGFFYVLPNFFSEFPAVQISSAKATVQLDAAVFQTDEQTLALNRIQTRGLTFERLSPNPSLWVRLADTDTQLRVKELLSKSLNPGASDPAYMVALNLQSASPAWLRALYARSMYLGLDLRGGVHFQLQVDMAGALAKKLDALANGARALLRERPIRSGGIRRVDQQIVIPFTNRDSAEKARAALSSDISELQWQISKADADKGISLTGALAPEARAAMQKNALQQNILTLSKRVNELGVAEPLVQQQGADRIIVELPGVQDTAKAKDIIGRTATLEAHLADPDVPRFPNLNGPVPPGDELFTQGRDAPALLKKDLIFSGERIVDAGAGFNERQQPVVRIRLDGAGGRALRSVSREHIGKPMAMVLFEKGKGEVLTVATIQSELGEHFEISGLASTQAANDLALLLRAGSLAAPMEMIEERTIGPSLGKDNIQKGVASVLYGFAAITLFMLVYYALFGVFSVLALALNLLLLVAILSVLQATLTLPGIAAIALTLGMAIDANALLNVRTRAELRTGAPPHTAISLGFKNAWATIFDSNVTTLIAGLALLAFGAGPVRGFAVVHCIGILTSMFSAVFFARGLVNLWHGRRRGLKSLAIGQVWRPDHTLPY